MGAFPRNGLAEPRGSQSTNKRTMHEYVCKKLSFALIQLASHPRLGPCWAHSRTRTDLGCCFRLRRCWNRSRWAAVQREMEVGGTTGKCWNVSSLERSLGGWNFMGVEKRKQTGGGHTIWRNWGGGGGCGPIHTPESEEGTVIVRFLKRSAN